MTAYCLAAALVGSLGISLALTPAVRYVAGRIGFVDKPDGRRKLHSNPMALGGGLAVQLAVLATLGLVLGLFSATGTSASLDIPFYVGLFIASALLTVVGIVDDAVGMRGRYKLACQVAACLILMAFGLRIRGFSVFQWDLDLGWMAVPITLVWLLGTINAINLLDGIDGLAASIGALLCLTIAALAILCGHFEDGLLAIVVGGALLGFLRYNFAPASIYLGDTGSMFIGFVIGAITIHGSIKGSASLAFAAPLCMVAIPMFDSCAALTRRKLTGRSLFAPDRGHFHHILLQRGYSVPQTVLMIVGICAVTCVGALLSRYFRRDVVAVCTMAFVIGALVSFRVFGHSELVLIVHRVMSALRSQFGKRERGQPRAVHYQCHMHGSCDWKGIWTALSESAETFGLIHIEFRMLMPSIGESFYAVWAKPNDASEDESWSVRSPLFYSGQLAGSLVLTGHARQSVIRRINVVTDFLDPIEDSIRYSIAKAHGVGEAPSDAGVGCEPQKGRALMDVPGVLSPQPVPLPALRNKKHRSRRKQPVDG